MTDESKRSGLKGLDIVGVTLVLVGILWAIFFPSPRYEDLGSYSLAQLAPLLVGAIGLACVISARFRR